MLMWKSTFPSTSTDNKRRMKKLKKKNILKFLIEWKENSARNFHKIVYAGLLKVMKSISKLTIEYYLQVGVMLTTVLSLNFIDKCPALKVFTKRGSLKH